MAVFAFTLAYYWLAGDRSSLSGPIVIPAERYETTSKDSKVSVTVVGEGIENPGTYELSSDSKVIDLLEKAEGLKKGAFTENIPWHMKLYKDLKLTVPTRAQIREVASGKDVLRNEDLIRFRGAPNDDQTDESSQGQEERIININEASAKDLQAISGIGPVLSKRIIQYREENGEFLRLDTLKDILGIGPVTFQQLRSRVEIR